MSPSGKKIFSNEWLFWTIVCNYHLFHNCFVIDHHWKGKPYQSKETFLKVWPVWSCIKFHSTASCLGTYLEVITENLFDWLKLGKWKPVALWLVHLKVYSLQLPLVFFGNFYSRIDALIQLLASITSSVLWYCKRVYADNITIRFPSTLGGKSVLLIPYFLFTFVFPNFRKIPSGTKSYHIGIPYRVGN